MGFDKKYIDESVLRTMYAERGVISMCDSFNHEACILNDKFSSKILDCVIEYRMNKDFVILEKKIAKIMTLC